MMARKASFVQEEDRGFLTKAVSSKDATVAQRIEHRSSKPRVAGSNPAGGALQISHPRRGCNDNKFLSKKTEGETLKGIRKERGAVNTS